MSDAELHDGPYPARSLVWCPTLDNVPVWFSRDFSQTSCAKKAKKTPHLFQVIQDGTK